MDDVIGEGDKPCFGLLATSLCCPVCFMQMLIELPIFFVKRVIWEVKRLIKRIR